MPARRCVSWKACCRRTLERTASRPAEINRSTSSAGSFRRVATAFSLARSSGGKSSKVTTSTEADVAAVPAGQRASQPEHSFAGQSAAPRNQLAAPQLSGKAERVELVAYRRADAGVGNGADDLTQFRSLERLYPVALRLDAGVDDDEHEIAQLDGLRGGKRAVWGARGGALHRKSGNADIVGQAAIEELDVVDIRIVLIDFERPCWSP